MVVFFGPGCPDPDRRPGVRPPVNSRTVRDQTVASDRPRGGDERVMYDMMHGQVGLRETGGSGVSPGPLLAPLECV